MALTAKQQRFAEEYLVDCNGAAAYRRAGYKPKTEEAARAAASRLLTNVNVTDAIAAARTAQQERTKISADVVLTGLHEEARFKGEGCSHSARVAAWGLLGKHLGLFPDKVQLSGELAHVRRYVGIDPEDV